MFVEFKFHIDLSELTTVPCLKTFIKYANTDEDEIVRCSALRLINKCFYFDLFTNSFVEYRGLEFLSGLLSYGSSSVKSAACSCLVTLCSKDFIRDKVIELQTSKLLVDLLSDGDLSVRADATSVLVFLCLDSKSLYLSEKNLISSLISNLDETGINHKLIMFTLQSIVNLCEYAPARLEFNHPKNVCFHDFLTYIIRLSFWSFLKFLVVMILFRNWLSEQ